VITREEKEAMLSLTAEIKCRLCVGHEKGFFPLAGQEFRNKVIEYFDELDTEIEKGIIFPPYEVKG
jgi:hypothetical protein